ncbi:hypothetical protein [Enemella evansiae]|uniref:hypothetical protein n=2 Tax=Enemella evansiae TaxID=2016499 RepID=UPI00105CC324|nr:hypothetical protein [Enemella evansiae]
MTERRTWMELVVEYRNGAMRRRVRRIERLTGVLAGVIALVGGALALLNLDRLAGSRQLVTIAVLSPVLAVCCVLLLAGVLTPAYARAAAPEGIAWRLRRDGVVINRPAGPVRIPWDRVRIDSVLVRGVPVLQLGGDGVETAYPEEFLSHDEAQIMHYARRYSAKHRPR